MIPAYEVWPYEVSYFYTSHKVTPDEKYSLGRRETPLTVETEKKPHAQKPVQTKVLDINYHLADFSQYPV